MGSLRERLTVGLGARIAVEIDHLTPRSRGAKVAQLRRFRVFGRGADSHAKLGFGRLG